MNEIVEIFVRLCLDIYNSRNVACLILACVEKSIEVFGVPGDKKLSNAK